MGGILLAYTEANYENAVIEVFRDTLFDPKLSTVSADGYRTYRDGIYIRPVP